MVLLARLTGARSPGISAFRRFSFSTVAALLLLAVSAGVAVAAPPRAHDCLLLNRRVLWLGDSITQRGEYVTYVNAYLARHYPKDGIDFISIGLSSETVSGLSEPGHPFPRPKLGDRLAHALTLTTPDVVVACYGMNDGIYHPLSPGRLAAFQHGIRQLAAAVSKAGARLILLTPPPFDAKPVLAKTRPADATEFGYSAPYREYDSVLAAFSAWEVGHAPAGARVIDVHSAMNSALAEHRKSEPDFSFASDGIHPNAAGHLLIARVILKELCARNGGADLDNDLRSLAADPLLRLVQKQRELRSSAWLKYVGYTRGETFKTDSVADAEREYAELQKQIDALR